MKFSYDGTLSNRNKYHFEGVVKSYTVSYGIVSLLSLICEGKEVFKED